MLVDSQSRKFKYLRLSLTEKCNFRCAYCLPNGYLGSAKNQSLTRSEIVNLVSAFQELGIEKVRLTGGEPTLRPDLCEIIRSLKSDLRVREVALTTNGYQLEKLALSLMKAGLDSLNVSVDSLQPRNFHQISGCDKGESVLRAVDSCLKLGFQQVKINCVVMAGINDHEFDDFVEYGRRRNLGIRFIELMRTGDNEDFFKSRHLSLDSLMEQLGARGWREVASKVTAGPARLWGHPLYTGLVGFISPYSENFCLGCNRLRVSSFGRLKLCLFGEGSVDLRDLLSSPTTRDLVKERVLTALQQKPHAHRLKEQIFGDTRTLSAIGG